MTRLLKRLAVVIAVFALLAVIAVTVYDLAVIRPVLPQIRLLLAGAAPENRNPPPIVRNLVLASHSNGQPFQQRAAALVYWRLNPSHQRPSTRLIRELLWLKLLPLHLSSSEQLSLYLALSYNGHGYGLSQLAQIRYGKSLGHLSPEQAAESVALLWAPTYLENHPERLMARRDKLLAAVQHEP